MYARTLLFGRALYFGDIEAQSYPWMVFLREARLTGTWLPWCTSASAGYPLWQNAQTGPFDPLNLLFLLPLSPTWLFGFESMLRNIVAAAGMYCLARAFGLRRISAATAAVVFALTGFMVSHQLHYSMVSAGCMLPWTAFGAIAWAHRSRTWGLPVAAISYALTWANYPQVAVMLSPVLAIGCVAAWGYAAADDETRTRRGGWLLPILLALVPLLLGTLLAGVQIVPVLALLHAGAARPERGYDFNVSFSLDPRTLVTWLLPRYYGPVYNTGQYRYWGPVPCPWETAGYAGGLSLVVALAVGRRLLERRLARALVALALAACALALGKYTPIYHVLTRLPVINGFRCPGRWLLVYSGAFALLCGEMLQLLRSCDDAAFLRRVARALAAIAGVSFAVGSLALLAPLAADSLVRRLLPGLPSLGAGGRGPCDWAIRDLLELAALAAVAGMAFSRVGARRWPPSLAAAILALLMTAQAVVFAWRYFPTAPADHYGMTPEISAMLSHRSEFGRYLIFGYEQLSDPALRPPGVRAPLFSQLNVLYGVPLLELYDPLEPPAAQLYQKAAAAQIGGRSALHDPRVASALAVDRLVVPSAAISPPGWVPLTSISDCTIYANTLYRGIAWTRADGAPPELAMGGASTNAGGLGAKLPRAAAAPRVSVTASPSPPPRTAHTTAPSSGRYRIEVGAGDPCQLVVAVANLPGWSATVNGAPAPITTENYAFMGIGVPRGECVVDLQYRPAGLREGAAVTLLGALLLLATAVLTARARRRGVQRFGPE